MALFLLVFFSVYGGMNFYVFLKARAAFSLGYRYGVPLGAFMALMVAAPVIIRLAERQGLDVFARAMAYLGYTWGGLVFLFISAAVVLDFSRLLAHGYAALFGDAAPVPGPRFSFYLPLALAVLVSVYGAFEAWDIRTERLTVETPRLPEGVNRVRIAQISDVHIGLIVRERRLEKILDVVRREEPDILVSTGDLVDGQLDDLSGVISLFKGIETRYGKYAVTGNHEFYAGLRQSLELTGQAGFTVLRGEAVTAGGVINIAGVDYPSRWEQDREEAVHEPMLLKTIDNGKFTLFLKHTPRVDEKSLGLFDLQLSGHTHRGQIFPFNLLVRIPYPRIAGLYGMENGSRLYVSRGSGTWGPPVRFLSPPEVTVIDVVRLTRQIQP